jgi:hypothetical protein
MKWIRTSQNPRQEIYELWRKEEKQLAINYHPAMGSLRIIVENEKRVFLLSREGLLRQKTVLRNEYGIKMGQLIYEDAAKGQLELNNQKFLFGLEGNTLHVSDGSQRNDLACTMENERQFHNLDMLALIQTWYLQEMKAKQLETVA